MTIGWDDVGEFAAGFLRGLRPNRIKTLVRRKLGSLIFWPDGMRQHVARIAEGVGNGNDLDEIARILRTTQDDTGAAYQWLHANRAQIIKALGPDVAERVSYVAYRKMGPSAVREQLMQMVADRDLSVERAQEVLDKIDQFNALLKEAS